MARRWLLVALLAAVVTISWARLEDQSIASDVRPMLLLALLPILAVALRRSRVIVALVLAGSTLLAAAIASGVPLSNARPRDPSRDFFGPVLDGFRRGFLDFYETQLPFDRIDFPDMQTVLLLAVFGFIAVIGMLVMARRPVGAALALVVAVAWPATLVPAESPLLAGALALVGVLAILFLLGRDQASRGLVQAGAVALVLVALAAVVSTTDAVAKPAFLSWQTWDPYDRPTAPVSVAYVWSANYDGITFPEEPTTVMRVKVPGAKRSLYWRATTLDDYTGLIWDEDLQLTDASEREQIDAVGPLLPEAAGNEDDWIRQEFTIEALRDTRLLASAQPVRWRPETEAPVADENGEVVVVPDGIRRDQQYTVWSYAPRPNPSELNTFRGDYPDATARYLEIVYQPVPEWGAVGPRDAHGRLLRLLRGVRGDRARVRVRDGARCHERGAVALRGGGTPRDLVPGGRRLRVRRAAAGADRRDARARRLRQRDEARLLPALRRRDGAHAAAPRRPLARGGRLRERRRTRATRRSGSSGTRTPTRGSRSGSRSSAGSRSTRPRAAASWTRRTPPTSQAFNAGDAADIGFADRLEGLSPTRAEAIRSAGQTPGLANPGFGSRVERNPHRRPRPRSRAPRRSSP